MSEFNLAPLLNRLFLGETLNVDEAVELMGQLMAGKVSAVQASALLAALRMRGETVEEITGFAKGMRQHAVNVDTPIENAVLDTCGTGGTGISTINISTSSLFVIAAAGVKIAKHGNRGVTKRSGSADMLEALGIDLSASPEKLSKSLEQTDIAFLFARSHHPAMKFVAPIRAELKARTVFNILGPLSNPAGANRQILGVFSPDYVEKLAAVLRELGTERALVVHGSGIDDFTVAGRSVVCELKATGELSTYSLRPEDVGLASYEQKDLQGGDPEENAQYLKGILAGEISGAKRDIVVFNAGAGLYLMDKATSIAEGVSLAQSLIDSGKAKAKLEAYIAFSQAA